MNNNKANITKEDVEKVYNTALYYGVREILSVPIEHPEICAPLTIEVSTTKPNAKKSKKATVQVSANKLGILASAEYERTQEGPEITDIAPASLLGGEEIRGLLLRSQEDPAPIPMLDSVGICARNMPSYDMIRFILNPKDSANPPELVSKKELRSMLARLFMADNSSTRMLYALLLSMEDAENKNANRLVAQYMDFFKKSPIQPDKIIRSLRFLYCNIIAEKKDLTMKLFGDHSGCLNDYLVAQAKDCDAARKLVGKAAIANINCSQTMLTEAIQICRSIWDRPTFR
ncbi:hypothetical protein IJJ53_02200 [Candidatus Saccharibacteria bacterium]|nr:hypothetical protein [Candidatus Saccharibacteria bacterium]